jgi:hypothetical protein
MFFVLNGEDDCVYVYSSREDAIRSVEGLDAEESIRAAFDEECRPYRIEWLEPNQYGRSFLGSRSVGSGRYDLVVAGPSDPQALLALLEKDTPIFASKALPAVESFRDKLRRERLGG